MDDASNADELDQLERWFWAVGFNESLRGKPDHYVVRAVENWRALVAGNIRGLEPRLRLSEDDFFERRLISGKALSVTFATMFARNNTRDLRNGDQIPAAGYMSSPDLNSFDTIFSFKELKSNGIDIGPSARILPNIILHNIANENANQNKNWLNFILERDKCGDFSTLASQFLDKKCIEYIKSGQVLFFLKRRAEMLQEYAKFLIEI
jgi:hypothetical protein